MRKEIVVVLVLAVLLLGGAAAVVVTVDGFNAGKMPAFDPPGPKGGGGGPIVPNGDPLPDGPL
jgi:hypothetical protein